MLCNCEPSPDDGEVKTLTWTIPGSPPQVQTVTVAINACGVQDEGTWYSAYTFDGVSKTLHLTAPSQFVPALPGVPQFRPVDAGTTNVKTIHIQCWGSTDVSKQNFDLQGHTSGVVAMFFTFDSSASGPIGNVNGP